MITTRQARPEENERTAIFYRENGYRPTIHPTDVILLAELDGALCAAVRICDEGGILVLRGMRVCKGMRRQGIGTRLLQAVDLALGESECFCIPLRYLGPFYGRIGFVVNEAPLFLRERCTGYRRKYYLDVVIMRRPKGTRVQSKPPPEVRLSR